MSSAESISQPDSSTAIGKANFDRKPIADCAAEPQIEQAIAQLIEGDFHRKWDSTKRLDQQFSQWGDRPVPYLIRHLEKSANAEDQWFLVRALAQFDHPAVVEVLARLLVTTPAEDLQLETIKALTRLGSSAIASLTDLLDPHQPLARRTLAARTLARIRRSATIVPLLSIANDEDPQLRLVAVEALGSFHDPQITPVLLASLGDVSPICIEAVRALGRRIDLLDTVDLIGPLQRCLYHVDAAIARESAVALGRLGGGAAVTALGGSLTQPLPTAVKIAVVRALGWMDTPAAVTYLTLAFSGAVPVIMPAVQQEIARSLGQTRTAILKPKAAQPLLDWLQAHNLTNPAVEASDRADEANLPENPEGFALKQTVISSLARLSARAALDSLIPLLGDPDSRIRMHALSALKQIDPRAAQTKIQQYVADENTSPLRRQQVAESLSAW